MDTIRQNKALAFVGAALLAALIAAAFIGVPVGGIVSSAIVGMNPGLAQSVKIGDAKFKLFPRPELIAGNISVSVPEGARQELLEIRHAHLAGSIAGLFSRMPHFNSLTLNGVKIFAGTPLESLAKFADEKGLQELGDRVERLKILNGSVVKKNAAGKEETIAANVNVGLDFNAAGGPSLQSAADFGAYTIKIDAAPGERQASSHELFPLQVSAAVDKNGLSLMNASLVVTKDAAANLISCQLVSGSLQGHPFTARATIDISHEKPAVALRAAFESLTLPKASLKPEMKPDILDGVLGNNLFDLNFEISASKVQGPAIELAPAHADGTLNGGTLTMDISKTQAYAGSLTGQLSVQKKGPAKSSFELRGAQLQKLLAGFSWHDAVSGSLDADGKLATPSRENTIESLSGNLSLNVKNGAVEAPTLSNIIQNFLGGQSQNILNAEGKLPFALAAQNIQISDGIATANDILFESALVRALGQGHADLSKRSLDFIFEPQIVSSGEERPDGNRVRVAITGTFERPEVSATGLGGAIMDKLESEGAAALGLDKQQRATVRDAIKTFQEWLNSDEDTKH